MVNEHALRETNVSTMARADDEFILKYDWCLDPFLTFEQLLFRMREEINRLNYSAANCQQEDAKLNLYLFACGVSCTVADYLSKRRWHIQPLKKIFPHLSPIIDFTEWIINLPGMISSSLKYGPIHKWKSEFDGCVELACRILLSGKSASASASTTKLKTEMDRLSAFFLPRNLLEARMRLNEGFRCQDLTYHDVIALADKFLATNPDRRERFVVVGARTAGSYFAPLLQVYLEEHGFMSVSWTTIRPKYGAHGTERKKLKRLFADGASAMITDDYSNTGSTLRSLAQILASTGVTQDKMVFLAPVHPVVAKRRSIGNHSEMPEVPGLDADKISRAFGIFHEELYLKRVMEPANVVHILEQLLPLDEGDEISLEENSWTDEVNRECRDRYPESFQVRLKRAYIVRIRKFDGTEETKKIIAKSVGTGWFGYHALIIAERLKEFIPQVFGLREGILFMEWIDGRPIDPSDMSENVLQRMATYTAARREQLSLKSDPRATAPYLGWGWLEILSILRRVYNPILGYLKHDLILKRMKKAFVYRPTVVDARMRQGEWLLSDKWLYKVDFEQHCFGAPELDVVDPAYDIAIASFEFRLADDDEEKLISMYSIESGDIETIRNRVFLYKLLYANAEAERSHSRLKNPGDTCKSRELNERILQSWNSRVFAMNKFVSGFIKPVTVNKANAGYFFMDIDGVLDSELMGFPHTTMDGIRALALLKSGGFEIIPNTGRSCEHVRNYCSNYGFELGVAEYGSVVVDANGGVDVLMVDEEVLDELSICRDVLTSTDGVFIDDGYLYSLRAYRYGPRGTVGLSRMEADALLQSRGLKNLKVILRNADTYFVGRGVDKGIGLAKVCELIQRSSPTIAIGDSDEDISMLRKVELAYAPSNCSSGIRQLASEGKCTILKGERQTGLLRAAEHLTGKRSNPELLVNYPEGTFENLMKELLTVADLPLRRRIGSVLRRSKIV